MKKLGQKIKEYRFRKGITQEELANFVGTTKASISNYERGHRNPPYNVLCAIAETLEVDSEELLAYMTEKNNAEDIPSSQADSKRPRRVKKLLAAFYKLSDEAQLIAIERVQELGLIPMYQRKLSDVLQQYINNRCRLSYELLENTETPELHIETPKLNRYDPPSDKPYYIQDLIRITFQHGIKRNEIQYWDFYYCKYEGYIESQYIEPIISSILSIEREREPRYNLAFVFVEQNALDSFYSYFEDWQNRLDLDPYSFTSYEIKPVLFLLIDKETLEIKDVTEFKSYDYDY